MSHELDIGAQLAAALRRAEEAERRAAAAEEEATRLRPLQFDGVTDLMVRRMFEVDSATLSRPEPNDPDSAHLMLVDVDYLTLWNDWFGHRKGDVVLRQLARTLEVASATHDARWYRIGGDELAGLLLGGDEMDIESILGQAFSTYQRIEIDHDQPLPPSFVFGHCSVAEMDAAHGRLLDECPDLRHMRPRDVVTLRKRLIIEIADGRAYAAKTYRRLLLLTQILERNGAHRFDELARWLLKGAGEIRRDTIYALAQLDERERIPQIEETLEEIFAAELATAQQQLRDSPGIRRPDVMRRQIVLELSRRLPKDLIRRRF